MVLSRSIIPYQNHHHDRLAEIWLRAVRETHTFLTEEDIFFYYDIVRGGVLNEVEIWVGLDEREQPVGFIGLDGLHIEMLFIDPSYHNKGWGTRLIRHVENLKGSRLTVDVNEQNPGACTFYKRHGFVQIGRSERDGSDRPFPLLHMELRR
ncbi:GNAT family N-acetyltransferase [Paenibacillus sp. A14]|uniref:GNAT family N-acetyltransferase n=1 Tax=Paenibacillus sp. A14 TaxID=3119820 RepID=UPI003FA6C241